MKIIDSFNEFVVAAAEVSDISSLRPGQAVYNLLDKVRPDIALMLNGSDYDPFFDEKRLPLFYDFVMRHW